MGLVRHVIKNNYAATTAPGVSNDSSQGYSIGSVWARSDTGESWRARSVAAGAAVWVKIGAVDHPGYVANNWYLPEGATFLQTGGAPGANSIRLMAGIIKARLTIGALGVRISTANAGNVQAAIYAADPTTKKPTGNAITYTASLSTASAAAVSAESDISPAPQVEAGLYWFATNFDNATAAAISGHVTANNPMHRLIGSATIGNMMNGGTGHFQGYSFAQAFGTWPDLTSQAMVEITNSSSATVPVVMFQPSSIP